MALLRVNTSSLGARSERQYTRLRPIHQRSISHILFLNQCKRIKIYPHLNSTVTERVMQFLIFYKSRIQILCLAHRFNTVQVLRLNIPISSLSLSFQCLFFLLFTGIQLLAHRLQSNSLMKFIQIILQLDLIKRLIYLIKALYLFLGGFL